MNKEVEITRKLVSFNSVSNLSNKKISEWIANYLDSYGFEIEFCTYIDNSNIEKFSLIAKAGSGNGGMAYFGHTDTVPVNEWSGPGSDPFNTKIKDGKLYGRGSCDMKGSIACMLSAISRIDIKQLQKPLYIVCTADEEIGFTGAQEVVKRSKYYNEIVASSVNSKEKTRCVVGEPTELKVISSHKGIVGFRATARGRAAHTSTREAINANWKLLPFLNELYKIRKETEIDSSWLNSSFDPQTITFHIQISDDRSVINTTAAYSECVGQFRPMPDTNVKKIMDRVVTAAGKFEIDLKMDHDFPPLEDKDNQLIIRESLNLTNTADALTVPYATDASALKGLKQVVVMGPGSIAQAHTSEEYISLSQLNLGNDVFMRCIKQWCFS